MFCVYCGKIGASPRRCAICGSGKGLKPFVRLPLAEEEEPFRLKEAADFSKPKNVFAIIGLAFTLTVGLSLIGIIFSIIGLVKSKKLEGSGRRLSKVCLIIDCTIWLLDVLLIVTVHVIFPIIFNW